MSLAKITAVSRLFDRSVVGLSLFLGLALAAGTAFVGA